jgi:hypothetical protein
MKFSIFFVSLAFSMGAQAHVEKGLYVGQNDKGVECSMNVVEMFFENGGRHPVNERLRIKAGGDEFIAGHPPVVDEAKPKVGFNHDRFQGLLATSVGAKALIMGMSHQPGKEGPTHFTVIDHDWKNTDGVATSCLNLKKK